MLTYCFETEGWGFGYWVMDLVLHLLQNAFIKLVWNEAHEIICP